MFQRPCSNLCLQVYLSQSVPQPSRIGTAYVHEQHANAERKRIYSADSEDIDTKYSFNGREYNPYNNRISSVFTKKYILIGRRLRCLFHRTYFVERQKLLRGENAQHPIFDSDVRSSHTPLDILGRCANENQTSGKLWEKHFSSFLNGVVTR